MGPENHVLDGVQIPHGKEQFLRGRTSHSKVQGHSAVVCAKTAEPNEMPFGLRTRVGSRNHVLDGGPDPPWEGAILEERRAQCCK